MIQESKKAFDPNSKGKEKEKEIGGDWEKLKRQAEYVNTLTAEFREKFPERAWHFPPQNDIEIPQKNRVQHG